MESSTALLRMKFRNVISSQLLDALGHLTDIEARTLPLLIFLNMGRARSIVFAPGETEHQKRGHKKPGGEKHERQFHTPSNF